MVHEETIWQNNVNLGENQLALETPRKKDITKIMCRLTQLTTQIFTIIILWFTTSKLPIRSESFIVNEKQSAKNNPTGIFTNQCTILL